MIPDRRRRGVDLRSDLDQRLERRREPLRTSCTSTPRRPAEDQCENLRVRFEARRSDGRSLPRSRAVQQRARFGAEDAAVAVIIEEDRGRRAQLTTMTIWTTCRRGWRIATPCLSCRCGRAARSRPGRTRRNDGTGGQAPARRFSERSTRTTSARDQLIASARLGLVGHDAERFLDRVQRRQARAGGVRRPGGAPVGARVWVRRLGRSRGAISGLRLCSVQQQGTRRSSSSSASACTPTGLLPSWDETDARAQRPGEAASSSSATTSATRAGATRTPRRVAARGAPQGRRRADRRRSRVGFRRRWFARRRRVEFRGAPETAEAGAMAVCSRTARNAALRPRARAAADAGVRSPTTTRRQARARREVDRVVRGARPPARRTRTRCRRCRGAAPPPKSLVWDEESAAEIVGKSPVLLIALAAILVLVRG